MAIDGEWEERSMHWTDVSGRNAREDTGCLGKEAFPSATAAVAAMRVYQKSGTLHIGAGLGPYRCPNCQEWHLGNEPRRAAPGLRRLG